MESNESKHDDPNQVCPQTKNATTDCMQIKDADDTAKKRERPIHYVTENSSKKQQVDNSVVTVADTKQNDSSTTVASNVVVDIATIVHLEPGARLEVQWDLHFENDVSNNPMDGDNKYETKQTRWWGGTLMNPDERTFILQDGDDRVEVPIRVIDYDPYVEGGFPDRSLEDVCFLSDHSLLNIASDSRAYWRREGDHWEPNMDMDEEERNIMSTPSAGHAKGSESDDEISVSSTSKEDGFRILLDTILQSAMQKAGIMEKMTKLDASQQRMMAEKIAKAKEKLIEKLMEQLATHDGNSVGIETVITKEHIIRCMEELQNDL